MFKKILPILYSLLFYRFLVDRDVKLFLVFAWYCNYVEHYHNMSYCA